ncbi:hypothetical protein P3X46_018084 [Hevea brasiliensis]|uniref:PGG domain-containing protein n=1 Tax=Hevea brasiliensis TaxID=3981 RepID=A0ABQ9LTG3_HEVBR|nr:hypothetical protein P3X46_018084 [Hevea brasiliensis]
MKTSLTKQSLCMVLKHHSTHLAARFGPLELAKEILKLKPEMVSEVNEKSETPLFEACREGRTDMVMLAGGRERISWVVYKVNQDNETILHGRRTLMDALLHQACSKGHLETTRELLRFDTDLSSLQDNDGRTPLHWAAMKGRGASSTRYSLECYKSQGTDCLDVVESDVSNSGALQILPAIQDAGGKRGDQLPPSYSTELKQIIAPESVNNPNVPSSSQKKVLDYPNHHHRQVQSEGLRNASNTITVVAVLIATVTFAAGINPPGGFNQTTGKIITGKHTSFKVFVVCNVVALFSSLGIVILLVSIIPFRRKSMMKLLAVTHKIMWVSTSFMAAAYLAAMWTTLPHGRGAVWLLVSVVAIGGGYNGNFCGKRKWRINNNKEKRKKESPSSSISRVEELKIMKGGNSESTTNSDVIARIKVTICIRFK